MGANDLILQKQSQIQSRKDLREWRAPVKLNLVASMHGRCLETCNCN